MDAATLSLEKFKDPKVWDACPNGKGYDENIPIFVAHDLYRKPYVKDGKTNYAEVATRPGEKPVGDGWVLAYSVTDTHLQATVNAINNTLVKESTPVIWKQGHTVLGQLGNQQVQPPPTGFGEGASFGKMDDGRSAVFQSKLYHLPGQRKANLSFPTRSVEFDPMTGGISDVAFLRSKPKLNMGVLYGHDGKVHYRDDRGIGKMDTRTRGVGRADEEGKTPGNKKAHKISQDANELSREALDNTRTFEPYNRDHLVKADEHSGKAVQASEVGDSESASEHHHTAAYHHGQASANYLKRGADKQAAAHGAAASMHHQAHEAHADSDEDTHYQSDFIFEARIDPFGSYPMGKVFYAMDCYGPGGSDPTAAPDMNAKPDDGKIQQFIELFKLAFPKLAAMAEEPLPPGAPDPMAPGSPPPPVPGAPVPDAVVPAFPLPNNPPPVPMGAPGAPKPGVYMADNSFTPALMEDRLKKLEERNKFLEQEMAKNTQTLAQQQYQANLETCESIIRGHYQAGYLQFDPIQHPGFAEREAQYQAKLTPEQRQTRNREIVDNWVRDSTGSGGDPTRVPAVPVQKDAVHGDPMRGEFGYYQDDQKYCEQYMVDHPGCEFEDAKWFALEKRGIKRKG